MDLQGAAHAASELAGGRSSCVWLQIVADTLTPVAAAQRLLRPNRGDFLLESVVGGEQRGRYSVLGLDPDLCFRAKGDRAQINSRWQVDDAAFEECNAPVLAAFERLQAQCRFARPEELPAALATLVGYFGFETIRLVERIPSSGPDPLGLPDVLFFRPSVVLIFDHLRDDLFLVAPVWQDRLGDFGSSEAALAAAEARLRACVEALRAAPVPHAITNTAGAAPLVKQAVMEPDHYQSLVRRAQAMIAAGDIFQVVLAQRFVAALSCSAFALYRALRRVNPSPFLFFLDCPGFALAGSSPEILVRLRDGRVTIRPIAGTRPRGRDPDADIAAERALLADPKERAEHLMLLDLGRNDLTRIAAPGSVEVTESFVVERYSHVMHIVSNVSGRAADGLRALRALLAGFPAGTVSGAPKIRACQIIAALEPEARGPYGGAVGYFGPDGAMDSCIVLRTAVVKDGMMHVTAGAGVVADSDPDAEQRECEAKADALFAAARVACEETTLF
ncbi:anthranilate synthase component I [Erythrobacteraceae bacterium CFH 75059]|uniref:anthranilate synthase component I family protein n=1 Tax=Qipengyuania thermophila TaxID=2509361 RepID=UPI001021C6CB|nr:chorismate-binding protein [Qipengyuania thermophila]TCD05273.1 anthranilate synthase component I [Erythrobacteraceae bacterium CFH 75059]